MNDKYDVQTQEYRFGIVFHLHPTYYPEQISFMSEEDRDHAFDESLREGRYFSHVRNEDVFPIRMYKMDLHPETFVLPLNLKVDSPLRHSDYNTEDYIGEWSDEDCPKCGAKLLKNKAGQKWCSNAGGAGMAACSYGLKKDLDGVEGDAARQDP